MAEDWSFKKGAKKSLTVIRAMCLIGTDFESWKAKRGARTNGKRLAGQSPKDPLVQ